MPDSGFLELPADLPIPTDDGVAEGIEGRRIPSLELAATTGAAVDLAAAASGTLVLYVYPRTGRPGEPVPAEWDAIPLQRRDRARLARRRRPALRLRGQEAAQVRRAHVTPAIHPLGLEEGATPVHCHADATS